LGIGLPWLVFSGSQHHHNEVFAQKDGYAWSSPTPTPEPEYFLPKPNVSAPTATPIYPEAAYSKHLDSN
jgi:hypothetical protein